MFNRVALLTSSGSVLLINDFSLTKPPSTTANQQFKMTNLHSDSTPISTLEESKRGSLTEKFIRKPFMQVFGGGIEKLRFASCILMAYYIRLTFNFIIQARSIRFGANRFMSRNFVSSRRSQSIAFSLFARNAFFGFTKHANCISSYIRSQLLTVASSNFELLTISFVY